MELKKRTLLAFTLLFLIALQPVMAQSYNNSYSLPAPSCTVNGQPISCSQFWSDFGWIFYVMAIVVIVYAIFWLWMLIDALTHDHKDKLIWVLVILIIQFLGAILYYFIVKRARGKQQTPQQNPPSRRASS